MSLAFVKERFGYKSLIDLRLWKWVNRASGKKMRNRSWWEGDSLPFPVFPNLKDKELWVGGQEMNCFFQNFAVKQNAKHLLDMVSVFVFMERLFSREIGASFSSCSRQ